MHKQLVLKFIYIDNGFIYKLRDYTKDKNQKYLIDYNNMLDKSIDKTNTLDNKVLVGSLILKKIRKIISRPVPIFNIYYVLHTIDNNTIENIITNIKYFFDGKINVEMYSDLKHIKNNVKMKLFLLDDINKC